MEERCKFCKYAKWDYELVGNSQNMDEVEYEPVECVKPSNVKNACANAERVKCSVDRREL